MTALWTLGTNILTHVSTVIMFVYSINDKDLYQNGNSVYMAIHSVNSISHTGASQHLTQANSYPNITRNLTATKLDNQSPELTSQLTSKFSNL